VAHWLRTFNTGQLETVRMWLDALPAELAATDASLAAARVLLALDTGHLDEVGGALDVAEASSPANTRLMFLRALHMYKTGDVGGRRRCCGRSRPPPMTRSSQPSTG
jgi:ATP/maltotriose-dependent transcriptional regulator MalT